MRCVQVHMLARIVVEIRSADLAVELEPTVVYRDVFYADNAHEFLRCTSAFVSSLHTCTNGTIWYVVYK
jgi:hypothetical protein